MDIWVDADACPNPIKDILYRAALRTHTHVILVANQFLSTPPANPYVKSIQVASGFDVADNYIVAEIKSGDLVITTDVPLAADAIAKDAHVLTHRGERYTPDNIQQRLTMRNFMEEIRNSGEHTGGPAPFSNTDKQQFANALDRLIAKIK